MTKAYPFTTSADQVDLWDVIVEGLNREGNFAVQENLNAGRPVYYCEDDTPEGQFIKEYPGGRRELIRLGREGEEVIRAL